jgi:hypothetical protein
LYPRETEHVRAIFALASHEASTWNHHWLGAEHLDLALLNPACPGLAPNILASYDLVLDAVRREYVEWAFGDPYDPPELKFYAGQVETPQLQRIRERALVWAILLRDEGVRSEHLLLAHADDHIEWDLSPVGEQLLRRGVTAAELKDRVLRVTEGIDAHVLLAQMPEARTAVSRPERPAFPFELARSPTGQDPRRRVPWSTRSVVDRHNQVVQIDGTPALYYVDRDRHAVRTIDGRLVGPAAQIIYANDLNPPGPRAFYIPPDGVLADRSTPQVIAPNGADLT